MNDLTRRFRCPNVPFICSESFSEARPEARQGADFLMEQRVRKTHRWLPPGVPSNEHWLNSIRNVEQMDKVSIIGC